MRIKISSELRIDRERSKNLKYAGEQIRQMNRCKSIAYSVP